MILYATLFTLIVWILILPVTMLIDIKMFYLFILKLL